MGPKGSGKQKNKKRNPAFSPDILEHIEQGVKRNRGTFCSCLSIVECGPDINPRYGGGIYWPN